MENTQKGVYTPMITFSFFLFKMNLAMQYLSCNMQIKLQLVGSSSLTRD